MTPGCLVVGSITVDVTAFTARLPRLGETVLGSDVSIVLGGKGANQAAAAAHFGIPTWMAGCIGSDPFADIAADGLRRHGVKTGFLRTVDGRTGVAHIRVDARGRNDIVITPLANAALAKADVDRAIEALAGQVNVLLLQLEVPAATTAYAARVGRGAGLAVVLDPAPALALPPDTWADVFLTTPNETEATAITGVEVTDQISAERAAAWFLERGTRHVVVTLGDSGAVYAGAGAARHFDALPVHATDSTAAGDAFTGTVGAALAAGETIDGAIGFGMAAGALAVTKAGASASLPYRAEIIEALRRAERSAAKDLT